MSAEEVVEALMMVEDQDDDLNEPMMDGSDDDFSILGEDERDGDFQILTTMNVPALQSWTLPLLAKGLGNPSPAPDLDPPTSSLSSMPSLPEPGPNHQSPSHSLPETWSSRLTSISIQPFSSPTGPTVAVPESPLDVFELFFPDDLVDFIVEESNRYAREAMGDEKYTKWVKVTAADIKAFLGFSILMGIVELPSLDDYWKRDPLLHYALITDRISRGICHHHREKSEISCTCGCTVKVEDISH